MRPRILLSLAAIMLNTGLFAQTVSIAGQSLDFSTPLTTNPSLTAGGTCAYDDVVTVAMNSTSCSVWYTENRCSR